MENNTGKPNNQEAKQEDLSINKSDGTNKFLTTNQGVKINDDNNSLKAGERGPSLLEDFILRKNYAFRSRANSGKNRSCKRFWRARFLWSDQSDSAIYQSWIFTRNGTKTPVFARFSTVAGSRGSTDLARDVRGFSVKFYTEEGIYDFVGNNIPVFFIQDANKFPDLVHAVKPEPHNEIPQASSAHDTFGILFLWCQNRCTWLCGWCQTAPFREAIECRKVLAYTLLDL